MPISSKQLGEVSALLQEGKNQEADDLLKKFAADANAAELAASGAASAPAPPRRLGEIINDLLIELMHRFGNPPQMQVLILELEPFLAKLE